MPKPAVYPKIFFLRHGQTEWNAEGRVQGQLESCLTPLGKDHAADQARVMAALPDQNLPCFVSPLGRAQQTARIALAGRSFRTDARLAEIHAGDWQGLTRDDIADGWPELFLSRPTPLELYASAPGGEGFAAFHGRIAAFLATLSGPSVIVAHGLLGQVLRGVTMGLNPARMGQLSNDQGCVYLLENGRETVLRPE